MRKVAFLLMIALAFWWAQKTPTKEVAVLQTTPAVSAEAPAAQPMDFKSLESSLMASQPVGTSLIIRKREGDKVEIELDFYPESTHIAPSFIQASSDDDFLRTFNNGEIPQISNDEASLLREFQAHQ